MVVRMTRTAPPEPHPAQERERPRAAPVQVYLVFAVLAALVASQQWLVDRLDDPAVATWSTIFVAIVVQSIPFLVGGVLLAAIISTLLSERALRRLVPANPALGDRKSTRLNSSHGYISYAVFCLKKKIRTRSPTMTAA